MRETRMTGVFDPLEDHVRKRIQERHESVCVNCLPKTFPPEMNRRLIGNMHTEVIMVGDPYYGSGHE
jgi:hypothetical protein